MSRYVPASESTFKGRCQKLFRLLAYDIWRREVRQFVNGRADAPLAIVDIGCGPGFLLTCLSKWFPKAQLTGIDADQELLDIARLRCPSLQTIRADATSIRLSDASVDVLFALHVIEHLEHPEDFFREARRVLRSNGLLVIATPNSDGLAARLLKEKWAGYSDPTHISLHGPGVWKSLLSSNHFEIKRDGTTGLSGIPLLDRMPLGLLHWIPTFFFGFYPWLGGEAYICTAEPSRS